MIIPNWNAPSNVKAFTSLTEDPPFDIPFPLKQIHDCEAILLPYSQDYPPEADAAFTREPDVFCAIRTADCLPLLVTNLEGNEIAAIHAGWRGLAAGVIESTFLKLHSPAKHCLVWLGPGICGQCYEVGAEVRQAFLIKDPQLAPAFIPNGQSTYLANLPKIAEHILRALGVQAISHSGICSFENLRCNSYRRDKGSNQRMISVIGFD